MSDLSFCSQTQREPGGRSQQAEPGGTGGPKFGWGVLGHLTPAAPLLQGPRPWQISSTPPLPSLPPCELARCKDYQLTGVFSQSLATFPSKWEKGMSKLLGSRWWCSALRWHTTPGRIVGGLLSHTPARPDWCAGGCPEEAAALSSEQWWQVHVLTHPGRRFKAQRMEKTHEFIPATSLPTASRMHLIVSW